MGMNRLLSVKEVAGVLRTSICRIVNRVISTLLHARNELL